MIFHDSLYLSQEQSAGEYIITVKVYVWVNRITFQEKVFIQSVIYGILLSEYSVELKIFLPLVQKYII